MVLFTLEGSKIFEVKIFLENYLMIVFIDVDPDWILVFNTGRYGIDSFFVLIGISVKGDLLSNGNADSEILGGCGFKFIEIFVIADISVIVFIPLLIELIGLFVGLDA